MSRLVSAADFIRRHLPAALGKTAPAAQPAPAAVADLNRIHCSECDAVLQLTSRYVRCRMCRHSLCDTPGCQQSHTDFHKAAMPAPAQTAFPLTAPAKPYTEPPLPAGAAFRCIACRRPLTPGTYRNCGLCEGHVCKTQRCQAEHFAAHRALALRATKAQLAAQTSPSTQPQE